TTGMSIRKYFENKLWVPLGGKVGQYEWAGRKDGTPAAEFGLRMRPMDMLKLGNLFLNEGKQGAQQILPSRWIQESQDNQIPPLKGKLAEKFSGYGYQWWLRKLKGAEGEKVVSAIGNGGQTILIFPTYRLVFVTTAGLYDKGPAVALPMLLEK